MTVFETIIIAIVEGITEFLPISSTGHMAITSAIMGINKDPFAKLFEVVIQFGAILSVVVLYWRKFFDFKRFSFYIKLIIAIIPALAFGALSEKSYRRHAGKANDHCRYYAWWVVSYCCLLTNGFNKADTDKEEDISNKQAFMIGCTRCCRSCCPD